MAQKMRAIGTLAGGIAHDFSNSLSSMMGYTEICLNESPKDSPLAPRLRRILQAGSLAKDLVTQILSFSRQNDADLKPVELGPIVEEAAKLLRATLPANVTIDLQLASGMGVILADPSQVHQIIMNLFVNAVHAMSETGGCISVGLKSLDLPPEKAQQFVDLEPGTYAQICVADTGRGMSPDTARRIFEPYFTTKPTGEGTGLGLSVVSTASSPALAEPYRSTANQVAGPLFTSICRKCAAMLKQAGIRLKPPGVTRQSFWWKTKNSSWT